MRRSEYHRSRKVSLGRQAAERPSVSSTTPLSRNVAEHGPRRLGVLLGDEVPARHGPGRDVHGPPAPDVAVVRRRLDPALPVQVEQRRRIRRPCRPIVTVERQVERRPGPVVGAHGGDAGGVVEHGPVVVEGDGIERREVVVLRPAGQRVVAEVARLAADQPLRERRRLGEEHPVVDGDAEPRAEHVPVLGRRQDVEHGDAARRRPGGRGPVGRRRGRRGRGRRPGSARDRGAT